MDSNRSQILSRPCKPITEMKKKQCSEIIEDYTMEILASFSEAGTQRATSKPILQGPTTKVAKCRLSIRSSKLIPKVRCDLSDEELPETN